MQQNVGKIERWGSLVGGGALLAYALRRGWRSPVSGILGLGAAGLLFRGVTGHCPVYGAMDVSTAEVGREWEAEQAAEPEVIRSGGRTWPLPEGARRIRDGVESPDTVDEASRESFPASDPPGFTPSKVG